MKTKRSANLKGSLIPMLAAVLGVAIVGESRIQMIPVFPFLNITRVSVSPVLGAAPQVRVPTAPQIPPGAFPVQVPVQRGIPPTLPPTLPLPYTGLVGWVDLHAHPMTNLAFGGKLIQGGVDIGSLLPTDSQCNQRIRASSLSQALGDDRPSHGGLDLLSFPCGDALRPVVIGALQGANNALVTAGLGKPPALGFPNFETWPHWKDVTHQKMWWEWIRRARDGGQRVMVALATNNRTLGDAVSGPGDLPTDDRASADLQLSEIKLFVARHPDFMEVALTAADLRRIVQSNRIAVVLGVEIDNIGNFNFLPPAARNPVTMSKIIQGEIQRLYDEGVRYVLPIHVVDNVFGGTAIYSPSFNVANYRETGNWWFVECAAMGEDITYKLDPSLDPAMQVAALIKIGMDPTRKPPAAPICTQPGPGHRNLLGLSDLGALAVKEMMKRGMIVDIDHMSNKAAEQTLAIAESISPAGYPIVSGHAGVRGIDGHSERDRSKAQLLRIARLHGMFGLGSDATAAPSWSGSYQRAMNYMGYMGDDPNQRFYQNGAIALGTDLNGFARAPMPGRVTYDASFQPSGITGSSRKWDYNTEGVAHYGMLPDFIRDVQQTKSLGYTNASGAPKTVSGDELVRNHLFRSADYFWHMWEQCEAQKVNVR
jgi:microsomal dipeptidase-like Zn-dependent dipeptidase